MDRGFPSQDIFRECSDLLEVAGKGVFLHPLLPSGICDVGCVVRERGALPGGRWGSDPELTVEVPEGGIHQSPDRGCSRSDTESQGWDWGNWLSIDISVRQGALTR